MEFKNKIVYNIRMITTILITKKKVENIQYIIDSDNED